MWEGVQEEGVGRGCRKAVCEGDAGRGVGRGAGRGCGWEEVAVINHIL